MTKKLGFANLLVKPHLVDFGQHPAYATVTTTHHDSEQIKPLEQSQPKTQKQKN